MSTDPKLKPRWDVHSRGEKIGLVLPVKPSNPRLENDPAGPLPLHHLRISPWPWFRCSATSTSMKIAASTATPAWATTQRSPATQQHARVYGRNAVRCRQHPVRKPCAARLRGVCGNPPPQQVKLTSSSELFTQNPRQAETAWRRQGRCEAHSQPQGKNHYGHSLRGSPCPQRKNLGHPPSFAIGPTAMEEKTKAAHKLRYHQVDRRPRPSSRLGTDPRPTPRLDSRLHDTTTTATASRRSNLATETLRKASSQPSASNGDRYANPFTVRSSVNTFARRQATLATV